MRQSGSTRILFALLLGATSGCGTMLNMQGKEDLASAVTPVLEPRDRPTIQFGGLANDVRWIKNASQPIDVIGSVLDMPFSLVGDIVTLPWVIYDSLIVVRPAAKETTSPTDPAAPK